jgi:hypothetical protein
MPKIIRAPRLRDDSNPTAISPMPQNASVGRKWRFRRNVVIYVAHRGGISQRLLADVFDLPRSRIAQIVRYIDKYNCIS